MIQFERLNPVEQKFVTEELIMIATDYQMTLILV